MTLPEDQVDAPEDTTEEEPQGQPEAVDIDGEMVPLDELKAGYMKDADYRRKTQEVAAMRQRLQLYEELDEHLAEHPEKKEQLIALLSDEPVEDRDSDDTGGKDEMSEENKRLREEFDTLKKELEDQKRLAALNAQLNEALEAFPDVDRDDVLAQAQLPKNHGKTFEDIAKELSDRTEAMKQKAKDEYLAELKEQEVPGLGRGISAMGKKPEGPNSRPGSKKWARELLDEADQGLLADLRKQEE